MFVTFPVDFIRDFLLFCVFHEFGEPKAKLGQSYRYTSVWRRRLSEVVFFHYPSPRKTFTISTNANSFHTNLLPDFLIFWIFHSLFAKLVRKHVRKRWNTLKKRCSKALEYFEHILGVLEGSIFYCSHIIPILQMYDCTFNFPGTMFKICGILQKH